MNRYSCIRVWPRRGAAATDFGQNMIPTPRLTGAAQSSYPLNFDEGHEASPEGEYTGYRDFSARFAAPPVSAKSSMDLGGRDALPLFNPPSPHDRAGRA
ncbi:hypothetical protein ABZP36_009168 [Zizania latifolia]